MLFIYFKSQEILSVIYFVVKLVRFTSNEFMNTVGTLVGKVIRLYEIYIS